MKTVKIRELVIGEGKPKICVPIVGSDGQHMRTSAEAIAALEQKPDLVEIRMDWFEEVFQTEQVKVLLQEIRDRLPDMPLLLTFRTAREGGERAITWEQYESLLEQVAASRMADAIDVEAFSFEQETAVEALVERLKKKGVVIIGSNHDFHGTPEKEELVRRLRKMKAMGMDVAKIAVMPTGPEDVLTLLAATTEAGADGEMCPVITMSMAGLGIVSRLSGEIFHSAVTFGCVGQSSAPGQIPLEQLRAIVDMIHGDVTES